LAYILDCEDEEREKGKTIEELLKLKKKEFCTRS
jgi:translation elongation factor EF-1alpha